MGPGLSVLAATWLLLIALFATATAPARAEPCKPSPMSPETHASGIPAGIRAEPDLPYADTAHPRQRLDLYLPASPPTSQPLPLVVFFHGGAFLGGDRKPESAPADPCGLNLLLAMVASGNYAAASIGYRLSPEALWPAQIHDAKAAIRWLRAHAARYHLDPGRIGVLGTSAGGHLAAMLGTSGGVASLEGDLGRHRDVSSRVTCVVDQYGPTDFLALHGPDNRSPDTPAAKLIGGPLPDHREAVRSASPITWAAAASPPFLIIHGTQDPVVSFAQSELLFAALQRAGVAATLVPVIGGGHGGFSGPELAPRIRAFLDQHLRSWP